MVSFFWVIWYINKKKIFFAEDKKKSSFFNQREGIVIFVTYQNQTNKIAIEKLIVAFVENSQYLIHFRRTPSAPHIAGTFKTNGLKRATGLVPLITPIIQPLCYKKIHEFFFLPEDCKKIGFKCAFSKYHVRFRFKKNWWKFYLLTFYVI